MVVAMAPWFVIRTSTAGRMILYYEKDGQLTLFLIGIIMVSGKDPSDKGFPGGPPTTCN